MVHAFPLSAAGGPSPWHGFGGGGSADGWMPYALGAHGVKAMVAMCGGCRPFPSAPSTLRTTVTATTTKMAASTWKGGIGVTGRRYAGTALFIVMSEDRTAAVRTRT